MVYCLIPPRHLNAWERSMLSALLAEPLRGNDELRAQIPALRVSEAYPEDDPTVIFSVADETVQAAPVSGMALVEAFSLDADGMLVAVLLHVVDGFLWELEVYRGDGGPLINAPDPSDLKPLREYAGYQDRRHDG